MGCELGRGGCCCLDSKRLAPGNAAVNFFIIMSGFVTHWAYAQRLSSCNRDELVRFLVRRLVRCLAQSAIHLLSWVCILASMASHFNSNFPNKDEDAPKIPTAPSCVDSHLGMQGEKSRFFLVPNLSKLDGRTKRASVPERMGRVVLTTWFAMLLGLGVLLVQLRGHTPAPGQEGTWKTRRQGEAQRKLCWKSRGIEPDMACCFKRRGWLDLTLSSPDRSLRSYRRLP